jgi:hypothetical protein
MYKDRVYSIALYSLHGDAAAAADATQQAFVRVLTKMFYRGIANFKVPVRPSFAANGSLHVKNADAEPIPLAIWFENRGGKTGYRVVSDGKGSVALASPEPNPAADLHRELEDRLVQAGLYRDEARAMVETWKDSWFEEGSRVFYVYPESAVDALLPLSISPRPQVRRVFVGRVELLAPWIREAIERTRQGGPASALTPFGRFLDAFISQIGPQIYGNARIEEARRIVNRETNYGGCVQ